MKEEIRHEAMSLVLAGIVATMVLATFKVTAFALPFPSFCLLSTIFVTGLLTYGGCLFTLSFVGLVSFPQGQVFE
jgi:hypothetical protein